MHRALDGLWKYRVRRFRIAYAVNRKTNTIRFMAVGPRQSLYEELTAELRENPAAEQDE